MVVFFLAAAVAILSIGMWRLTGVIDDLQGDDACRSDVAGEVSRIQGELSAAGWIGILAAYQNLPDRDRQIATQAARVNELVDELAHAQDRRDRVNQICS